MDMKSTFFFDGYTFEQEKQFKAIREWNVTLQFEVAQLWHIYSHYINTIPLSVWNGVAYSQ